MLPLPWISWIFCPALRNENLFSSVGRLGFGRVTWSLCCQCCWLINVELAGHPLIWKYWVVLVFLLLQFLESWVAGIMFALLAEAND